MRSCPTCQRTFPDYQTICMYDGAQLSQAYDSQQSGPPQGAHPMMPPGYPPPVYPPQGGWQPNYTPPAYPQVTSEYVACPQCRRPDPVKLNFTWWGGMLGPRMFHHVKCRLCGYQYNGKTGESNTTNIVIYSIVGTIIGFAFFAFILYMVWG